MYFCRCFNNGFIIIIIVIIIIIIISVIWSEIIHVI